MSVQDGTRWFVLVIVLFLGLGAGTAAPVRAEDIDLDAVDVLQPDAAALQAAAISAAVDGRWELARSKASAALALDTTVATAQSRLVLARSLEALGDLDAALVEVDRYLALRLLDRDRAKGEETRDRIARTAARAPRREEASTATPRSGGTGPARRQRDGSIGLLAGGAAPTIVGLWLVGTDVHYATQGITSGTWAAIGTPALITGLVMEVAGAVLLATASPRARRTTRLGPRSAPGPGLHVGVAPDPRGGVFAGLWGRF